MGSKRSCSSLVASSQLIDYLGGYFVFDIFKNAFDHFFFFFLLFSLPLTVFNLKLFNLEPSLYKSLSARK